MKTIIFIESQRMGTSYEMLKDAKALGLNVVLFTKNIKFLKRKETFIDKIVYLKMSCNYSKLKKIIEVSFESDDLIAIVSIIEEYVKLAYRLNNHFVEKNNCIDFAIRFDDKLATRNYLKGSEYNLKTYESKVEFPCVLKELNSSGSKGVFYIEDQAQLDLVRQDAKEHLIEEFFNARQVLVEVVIENNKISNYFIINQEIKKFDKFIITGYGLIPGRKDRKIEKLIYHLIDGIDIKYLSFHIEVKIKRGKYKLIEVNKRCSGGNITELIKLGSGYKITDSIAHSLVKRDYHYDKINRKVYAAMGVSDTEGIVKRISGKGKASKTPGVIKVNVRNIKNRQVSLPTSMGKRYSYVIATASTLKKAKAISKDALANIKFHFD